jgi:hypothetical protein
MTLPVSVSPEYGEGEAGFWGANASFQLGRRTYGSRAFCRRRRPCWVSPPTRDGRNWMRAATLCRNQCSTWGVGHTGTPAENIASASGTVRIWSSVIAIKVI